MSTPIEKTDWAGLRVKQTLRIWHAGQQTSRRALEHWVLLELTRQSDAAGNHDSRRKLNLINYLCVRTFIQIQYSIATINEENSYA
jgi:hypothetical protein